MKQSGRKRKRLLAGLLVACLVFGLAGQEMPAALVQAGTEVKVPQKYTVELTGTSLLYLCNEKASNGSITLEYTVESMEAAEASTGWQGGIVATTNPNQPYPYVSGSIKLGAWNAVLSQGKTYRITLGEDENGVTYSGVDAELNGYVNTAAKGSQYYGIYIQPSLTGKLTNVQCYDENGNELGVQIGNGNNAKLAKVESEAEAPQGYTSVTFYDYGLNDGTATESIQGYAEEIASFDGVVLQTQIGSATPYAYVRFGNQNETGIELIWDEGGNLLENDTFSDTSAYHTMILKQDMKETYVNVSMYINYVGIENQDLQVQYYIDDKYVTTIVYEGCAGSFGKYVTMNSKEGSIHYKSIGERKVEEQQAVSYDISKKSYLITGNNVTINGEAKSAGDVLDIPGDYNWVSTECKEYRRKIVLYKVGDVDLNGTAGEESDWNALEVIVENGGTTETVAAKKGADLNNDGKIDGEDLRLAKQVQNVQRTLDELIREYYPPSLSYDFLGGNEVMPISGFFGPYRRIYAEDSGNDSYDYLTDEVFQLVKNSGINLVNYAWRDWYESDVDMKDMLSLAEKYQIGYFINDARLNTSYNLVSPSNSSVNTALTVSEAAGKMGDYTHYQSLLGTHVFDEPVPDDWSISDKTKQLKYFKDIANTLNTYVNTNGFMTMRPADSACFSTAIVGKDYSKFWNTFISGTNPQVLAFDDYPFNDKSSEDVTNATGYFKSLSVVRKKALDNQLPFWTTVQAGGQFKESSSIDEDLIATEAETYWNVNTSLAYGAKGIAWFTLIENSEFATNNTDKSGLIRTDTETKEVKATKFYTWAQNANKQIQAVDEVLMKASNKGIVAAGGTSAYAYTQTKSVTDSAIIEVSATEHLQSVRADDSTYGALIGCFDYKDSEAYYVVNYDVTEGETQNITLTFDDQYNYYTVAEGKKTSDLQGNTCSLTIPSGKAVLVVLEGTVAIEQKQPPLMNIYDADVEEQLGQELYLGVGLSWAGGIYENRIFGKFKI